MNRDEWLESRRAPCDDGMVPIHASEVAAILGEDDFRDALSVYAEKLGHDVQETEPMALGRIYEAAILTHYERQTGLRVTRNEHNVVARCQSHPWLRATFDGWHLTSLLDGRQTPVQAKMSLGSGRRKYKDGPPVAYWWQVQAEIACAGTDSGVLCALVDHGPLAIFEIERDPSFFEIALPLLQEFRERVRDGRPPEATERSGPAIRSLWGGRQSGETLELGDEGLHLALGWESWEASARAEQREADAAKNRLLVMMGDASFARLPDGSYLIRRKHGNGVRLVREMPRRRA